MLGFILAWAFAAAVPAIIAKTLKLPIKACFMIFLRSDDKGESTQ
jgi:hypothetical protein